MPQIPPGQENQEAQPQEAAAPIPVPTPEAPVVAPENPTGPTSQSVEPPAADPAASQSMPAEPGVVAPPAPVEDLQPGQMGPPSSLAGDDLTTDLSQRHAEDKNAAIADELEQAFGKPATADPEGEAALTPGTPRPDAGTPRRSSSYAGRAAIDMTLGFMETPTQVVGGARDAIQATINLAGQISSDLRQWMPHALAGGYVSDEEGLRYLGKEDFDKWQAKKGGPTKTMPQLPEVDPAKSVTGGIVRGASQFATGMLLTRGVGQAGALMTLPKILTTMAQGGAAGFVAFNGADKHMSNMIEELAVDHPALHNIVTSYLASEPSNSEYSNRFKMALEGEGLGLAAKAVFNAVRGYKIGKAMQATENIAQEAQGIKVEPSPIRPDELHVLGDPESPKLVLTEKINQAVKATDGLTPADITGGENSKINWLAINSAEDIQKIKDVLKEKKPAAGADMEAASRGTRSWELTKATAADENAWQAMMERRPGQALNAEELYSSKQLWLTSKAKMDEVTSIASAVPTDANIYAARKMMAVHYAIQKDFFAARAEAGRALNAMKAPVGTSIERATQIAKLLEDNGGREVSLDLIRKVSQLSKAGNSMGVEAMMDQGAWAKTANVVRQVWMNGLLSNPASFVANGLSNFGAASQQIYERQAAAFISKALGTENGVAMGEAFQMAHGMLTAGREGLEAFSKNVGGIKSAQDAADKTLAFLKGDSTMGAESKFEGAAKNGQAFADLGDDVKRGFDKFGLDVSSTTIGKYLTTIDVATQVPGRMLSRADDYGRGIGYRMELHAQALRQATKEFGGSKVDPAVFNKRVAEIIADPPKDINSASVTAATYQTFQNTPAALPKRLGDAIQSFPVLGRLLMPFKNTPINIMTWSAERSPLAPLVGQWRADFAAGGARKDIALARMGTGTMLLQLGMDMAISERITGRGPEGPGQAANYKARGLQPYSFKLPGTNTWMSFNRLEPVGTTFGIAADIATACLNARDEVDDKTFEDAMIGAAFAISNQVVSKTYMQGMAQFMGAVSSPEMMAKQYVQRVFGSVVPAGVAAIARNGLPLGFEGDPYLRGADDIADSLYRRIPGLSADLPLHRDLFGRTQDYRSGLGWGFDMLSPSYLRTENPEAIDTEMHRLQYYPKLPNRTVNFGDARVKLDGHEYDRFMELAGNGAKSPAFNTGAKDFLNAVVSGKHAVSAGYKAMMNDEDRANWIQSTLNDYRQLALRQLLKENQGLAMEVKLKQKDALKKRMTPQSQN